MASLRKLRRRLRRWDRYAAATGHTSPRDRWSDARHWLSGHCRVFDAVEAVADRRNPFRGYGPCYCVGCIGSGRCEQDDADDFDDSVCECDSCQLAAVDEDDAWDDAWPPMPLVTETGFAERGLL